MTSRVLRSIGAGVFGRGEVEPHRAFLRAKKRSGAQLRLVLSDQRFGIVMPHSFLFVSWGISGNMTPLLTAGRQLRCNGHRVRVMADPAMQSEIGGEFDFVTWQRAPTGSDADPTDASDRQEWLRQAIFRPAAAYAADVREEIERRPTDAVVCLDLLFGVAVAVEAAGLPLFLLSPHISIRPLPGLPPAISGLPKPETEDQRAEVEALLISQAKRFNEFLPDFNKLRMVLGLLSLRHIYDQFDRADRVLLAISESFDFEADALPPNFRYVGPLLDIPAWSGPWHAPWPERQDRPRALIACSTGAQGQKDLMQRIFDGVDMVDIEALATAGPSLRITDLRTPKNVLLVQSAPHDAVMREVSVVITQGGHGTVCSALVNDLPLLILPCGRDQVGNAARVKAKGAGLVLPSTASPVEVAAAINELISEPRYKFSARRLGRAIRADIIKHRFVHEVEAVMADRHASR